MKGNLLRSITGLFVCAGVLSLAACGTVDNKNNNTGGEPCLHEYGQYWSDENATCEQDGTKTAYCNKCGIPDTVPDVGSKRDQIGRAHV